MAAIEDLIKQIADTRLRDQLAAEVARLKSQKKFGLVFEEHLPELLRLPGMAARLGSRVLKKDDPRGVPYRVTAEVNGKRIRVRPEAGGDEETVERAAVVVARAFGEPMYPALIPVDSIERAPGKPWHVLINADNYHALQLLLYGYEGKVDVIYIDPPYNTGARNWKYNNDYVDDTDQFRHSKWLSMMKKRLVLAGRLLKPDGVLIVTIDENEDANLALLLRELFPDYSDTPVPIVHNPRGIQGDNFSYCHEIAHFIIPMGLKRIGVRKLPREEQDPSHLRNWGGESTRDTAKTAFYPLYFKNGKFLRAGDVPLPAFHPAKEYKDLQNGYRRLKNGEQEFWPIDPQGVERKWRYGKDSVKDIAHLLIVEEIDGVPQVLLVKDTGPYKTVWKDPRFDASSNGTQLLTKMGLSFPYAKSLYAVLECLEATVGTRPDAVIVDFFAGSGTTAHATALLNATDGGRRRTILCTNNEVEEEQAKRLAAAGHEPGSTTWESHGIAESVTWPRFKRAFSGRISGDEPIAGKYKNGRPMSDGFEENAAYFKLDFLDPGEVTRGERFEAIVPILWMLAGCRGACQTAKGSGKWFMPKGNPFAVLLRDDAFREFVPALRERADIDHVFLVTDSTEAFHEMASDLGDRYRCIQLYRSYLDTFRINLIEPGTISPTGVPTVPTPATASAATSGKVEA